MSQAARILHVDGAAGISGDIALGALVDLGVPIDVLRDGLAGLDVPGWAIRAERVDAHGVGATRVHVDIEDTGAAEPAHAGEHGHRHWPDIERILDAARLPGRVRERARAVFRRLAEVEAGIHGIAIDDVELHEVGALDALVDVVGACLGLEHLGVTRITCSPPDVGGGTVSCRHGVLPVPAPATVKLLEGRPVRTSGLEVELTTPTGAALLATLADDWGTLPAMTIERVGYGAGSRELPDRPNVVRFVLGRPAGGAAQRVVLEADLDDAEPELIAAFVERARELGALDATQAPLTMKKGRAGIRLTVLCTEATRPALVDALFAETTTIGCRWHAVERAECERDSVSVETRFGPVRLKVARWKGQVVNRKPEHEDCLAAARRAGVPVKTVAAAALAAAEASGDIPR